MTETTKDIVSDADIERVHANAHFGSMSKRRVVDEGVMKYAFGFTSGGTVLSILGEHGLVRRPRSASYDVALTAKGKRYLRAMAKGRFAEIFAFICEEGQSNDH